MSSLHRKTRADFHLPLAPQDYAVTTPASPIGRKAGTSRAAYNARRLSIVFAEAAARYSGFVDTSEINISDKFPRPYPIKGLRLT
jgi:hypothetical protein